MQHGLGFKVLDKRTGEAVDFKKDRVEIENMEDELATVTIFHPNKLLKHTHPYLQPLRPSAYPKL